MAILGSTTLTGCNSIPDFIAGGSIMMFQQTSSPTNWTKDTTINNRALRVVNGTIGSGGSTPFTTVFSPKTPSGTVSVTVGQTTLAQSQIAGHNHEVRCYLFQTFNAGAPDQAIKYGSNSGGPNAAQTSSPSTSSGSHSHPDTAGFSGQTQDFNITYTDTIIASKD